MFRQITLILLLFSANLFSASTIDPAALSTGDIIGVSSRREVSGFMVQAFTQSPIDHVAVVEKGPDGAFVWHLTRTGSTRIPLAEFVDKYRAVDGQLYFAVGRVNPPLTADQQKKVVGKLSQTRETEDKAPVCSEYVADAFHSAGVELGQRTALGDPTTNPLAGFMAPHWNRFFRGHTTSIPSSSLFERPVKVTSANIPLAWTDSELLEAWEKTGDASKVARIYFPQTRVDGPHEAQALSEDFFSALRAKTAKPLTVPACPFQQLGVAVYP